MFTFSFFIYLFFTWIIIKNIYGKFDMRQYFMSNATSTNYFTTFIPNVDVDNLLLVFI